VRHSWQAVGDREVPWSALPITVRVCRRCGCEKTREPCGAYFRPVYTMPDGATTTTAPDCPGQGDRDGRDATTAVQAHG
jgi:hypothetical protein